VGWTGICALKYIEINVFCHILFDDACHRFSMILIIKLPG
jgi:hypothetical protein